MRDTGRSQALMLYSNSNSEKELEIFSFDLNWDELERIEALKQKMAYNDCRKKHQQKDGVLRIKSNIYKKTKFVFLQGR